MSISILINAWNDFWFRPTSPASVCVFRIVFGILLFGTAVCLVPDHQIWFGPNAIVSERAIETYNGAGRYGILFMLPRTASAVSYTLYALMICSVLITIGFFTRTSLVVAFCLIVSLWNRNPMVFNCGDMLLKIFTLLLIFAPAGSMYSLDAWFNKRKGIEAPTQYAPWAQRLIQLQVAAVYCQTFWWKAASPDWIDGTAVYWAAKLPEYAHYPVPFLLDHLVIIKILTWSALLIEFSLWTLVWVKELRYWVLAAGLALHLGIEWSMNIPFFEFIMSAGYIAFVNPLQMQSFVAWLAQPFVPKKAKRLSVAEFVRGSAVVSSAVAHDPPQETSNVA